jgi:hypothetical protein
LINDNIAKPKLEKRKERPRVLDSGMIAMDHAESLEELTHMTEHANATLLNRPTNDAIERHEVITSPFIFIA